MSFETIISSDLTRPDEELNALVLMGGGARTAYQAGVLQALARVLSLEGGTGNRRFPFSILVGTSAGALNACYLASRAFEPGFIKALMALGERDAYARKDELLAFFGATQGR